MERTRSWSTGPAAGSPTASWRAPAVSRFGPARPILACVPADGDATFCAQAGELLAALPGVEAVTLGGSRAAGTARPDSDWDFAVYYRGTAFDPDSLGSLGWPGEIFPIGGWGGGVFNGGAWLTAGDRHVDVHYRDLDDVAYHLAEAQAGRFRIERLMFHLAGIPTYIVAAELALNEVLHGELPRPVFPAALRPAAEARWRGDARATLGYARAAHAARGHLADTAGAIAVALCQGAHAVLAARGEWITNEKSLLDRAGLRGAERILAGLTAEPGRLLAAVDQAAARLDPASDLSDSERHGSRVILARCSAKPRSARSWPTGTWRSAGRYRVTWCRPARRSSGPTWASAASAATTGRPGPGQWPGSTAQQAPHSPPPAPGPLCRKPATS